MKNEWWVPWVRLKWQWRKIRRTWWDIRHLNMETRVLKAQYKVYTHKGRP